MVRIYYIYNLSDTKINKYYQIKKILALKYHNKKLASFNIINLQITKEITIFVSDII